MRTRDLNKQIIIREKAIEMIVAHGFHGLSMHKLAKEAGVSVATIYIYFKDREDLLQQIYKEESKKMTEATLKNFDPESHFAEGLKVQWTNRMNHFMNNPLSMTFMEQFKHSPLIDRSVTDRGFIDAMTKFAQIAIERNELISLPVEVFWSIAFAPLYQLVKFHLGKTSFPGRPDFIFDEEKINQTFALVVKALQP